MECCTFPAEVCIAFYVSNGQYKFQYRKEWFSREPQLGIVYSLFEELVVSKIVKMPLTMPGFVCSLSGSQCIGQHTLVTLIVLHRVRRT